MKIETPSVRTGKNFILMDKNDLAVCRGRHVRIHCSMGEVLVTWRNGGEASLERGQSVRLSSGGKICVLAASESRVSIEKESRPFFKLFPFSFGRA